MAKSKQKSPPAKTKTVAKKDIPLPINIIGWFGIAFSLTYLIMGTVNIILSIMDRTYADMGKNFIILMYGIPILIVSLGFKNMQKWGWYCLGAVLALVVILSIFNLTNVYGIIPGVAALAALVGLFLPSVRKHYITG